MLLENVQKLERGDSPLYVQLARVLREQIDSAQYKPGDSLPTEEQLSKAFGVSLITVREACRILVDEGLILKRSGKGTFVAEKPAIGAYLAAGTIEDLIYAGHETETRRKCVSRKLISAEPRLAELLQIPPRSKAFEVESIMYVGEIPFAHVTAHVSRKLGRLIPEKRLSEKPMTLLLREIADIQIDEVDQWTIASQANKRIAEALRMAVGDPVLVVQRVFYDFHGAAILTSVNSFRCDRFRHHVRLHWTPMASRRRSQSLPSH